MGTIKTIEDIINEGISSVSSEDMTIIGNIINRFLNSIKEELDIQKRNNEFDIVFDYNEWNCQILIDFTQGEYLVKGISCDADGKHIEIEGIDEVEIVLNAKRIRNQVIDKISAILNA